VSLAANKNKAGEGVMNAGGDLWNREPIARISRRIIQF